MFLIEISWLVSFLYGFDVSHDWALLAWPSISCYLVKVTIALCCGICYCVLVLRLVWKTSQSCRFHVAEFDYFLLICSQGARDWSFLRAISRFTHWLCFRNITAFSWVTRLRLIPFTWKMNNYGKRFFRKGSEEEIKIKWKQERKPKQFNNPPRLMMTQPSSQGSLSSSFEKNPGLLVTWSLVSQNFGDFKKKKMRKGQL